MLNIYKNTMGKGKRFIASCDTMKKAQEIIKQNSFGHPLQPIDKGYHDPITDSIYSIRST